ncbi:MAG: nuclear transport factor 2 family protein [Fibrobacteria bacterium]
MEKAAHRKTTVFDAKEIVLEFVEAINNEDFAAARGLADDDMVFVGVMGSRHGADAYFKDMEKMRLKYAIKKVFADGEDVCLFYDLGMDGKTVFGCGWYGLENGLVKTLKVLFDPRPFLKGA